MKTSVCCDAKIVDGYCTYCGDRTVSIESELQYRKNMELKHEMETIVKEQEEMTDRHRIKK